MLNALGLIEVIGYVGAVEAADAALKAANVTLIGIEKVSAGIVTVKITGDVGAVKAAVEASEESVKRLGVLRTSHVIARVHEDVKNILEDKDKENVDTEIVEVIEEPVVSEEITEEVLNEETVSEETSKIEEEVIEDITQEEVVEEPKKTAEDFAAMKVEELRRLARNLKIPTMTNKQIKFAKKDVLIEELLKFYKESDK